MSDQPAFTTAAVLNDFRRELLAGGYDPDTIRDLACIALKWLVENDCGLFVRAEVAE
jgi:hypothetical protein